MPSPAALTSLAVGSLLTRGRRWPQSFCLTLAWTAACVSLAVSGSGCSTLANLRLRNAYQASAVPRPRFSADPQMEEVVDHLNQNVEKLHSWRAHNVKIRANNMPLSGTLAVEEGQHLRLVVESLAGHEVDLGSNDDVFWIWAKRMEPAYIYCSHEQIDDARDALGVPFEPEWLMQALGVAPLDTNGLTMQIDPTGKKARLVQQIVTAHGQPLQKVITVDLVQGVIVQHEIHDARGQLIAQARLEDYRVYKESGVVLPRRVRLDWPQYEMSLVMNFGQIEVNPAGIPGQIWDMPQMPGVQMVNLGEEAAARTRTARGPQGTTRTAGVPREPLPRESAVELMEPETEPAADDDTGRVRLVAEDPEREYADVSDDGSSPLQATEFQTAPIERPVTPAAPARSSETDWWDQ